MRGLSYRHLDDQAVVRDLVAAAGRESGSTAEVVALIAEFQARELHAAAGYSSMFLYCVRELRMSDDCALKRIRVANLAREFPAIFPALAEGRLNLSAVLQLKPFLKAETVDELLAAVAGKTRVEIESLLAERFPKPDLPTRIESLARADSADLELRQLAPGPVATKEQASAPRTRLTPLAAERFAVQFTMTRVTRDKLRHAEALLSHQVAPGQIAEVFDRALDALIPQLEKRKFGATERPRRPRRASRNPRYIPADVRRTVWERDGGQCSFVGDSGHRCESRTRLEFDHIEEVARGGKSTVSNLRLLCRAHNQHRAAHTFGAGFMDQKRRAAAESRAAAAQASRDAAERDVTPWLRELGFRGESLRRAAEHCEGMPDATLEARVRAALSFLAPPARRTAA